MSQLEKSNCASAPSEIMVELAEFLVDLIPVADWAFFAKNGGDITNFALMIARAETNRKKIIMISGGYHGVSPWAQAPGHHGVISEDYKNIIRIPFNDYNAFEKAIDENPGEIAGFISTPYHHPVFADSEMPVDGYWKKVEEKCNKEGIVFILDDVRCGFRLDMGGSNEYFGFKPDLICFCKAIGNGYPISALVGIDSLKNIASKVFYTGSYWFSSVPMAAALSNLNELRKINGPKVMLDKGQKLLDQLVGIAKNYGFDLKVTGASSMPYLRITNDDNLAFHQEWCAQCTKRGAFFTSHHNWFISTAHSDEDIQKTLEIVDDAFNHIKQ